MWEVFLLAGLCAKTSKHSPLPHREKIWYGCCHLWQDQRSHTATCGEPLETEALSLRFPACQLVLDDFDEDDRPTDPANGHSTTSGRVSKGGRQCSQPPPHEDG
ncbi:hypothetical protein EB796_008589 [Bugula neritina]|uniref:Uncharacterized protein n=1 Tax=Bugula neritina TaxID=10212 RepID=A0A7J7K3A2_BUGNE|nr:hypothetical protein EB796_008589 [Bugula neritina]